MNVSGPGPELSPRPRSQRADQGPAQMQTDEQSTVNEEILGACLDTWTYARSNRFLTVVPEKLCENVCSPPAFGHVFVEPLAIDGVLL
jgi:hypothetical protein